MILPYDGKIVKQLKPSFWELKQAVIGRKMTDVPFNKSLPGYTIGLDQ